MSGTSNVGTGAVYEAGDQRNPPDSEKPENQSTPYEEGKSNSHNQNDPSKLFVTKSRVQKLTRSLQRTNAPSQTV
jgi:hypothetical protein